MVESNVNGYLEHERMGKLMRKYTIPCVISMLVAALYNIVDQIFIANASYLGSYGNAANTVVFPMTVVAIAIAVMIGNGCCTFVSISLGAKERENAGRGIGSSVLAVVAVGLAEYAQIPTAVAGIVMKFFQIIISVSAGLAAGCIPISGYNIGAKRNDRVIELMKRLMAAEALVGLAASLIFLLLPYRLIGLFGAENESVYYTQFAVWFIRGQLCLLPLACVNKGTFIFLQSLGRAKQSSALSITREIVFGAGLPILLPLLFGGLYALPFFMPAADTLTFLAVALVLYRTKISLERPLAEDTHALSPEHNRPSAGDARTDMIITLGRAYGSGGRSVGRRLAERLRIPYYDAALLEEAANRSGLSQKFLASMDEKPQPSHMLYQYMGFGSSQYKSFEELANQAQREVIEAVA